MSDYESYLKIMSDSVELQYGCKYDQCSDCNICNKHMK